MDCVGVPPHHPTVPATAMLSVGDGATAGATGGQQQQPNSTPTSPTSSLVSVTASAAVFPPADTDQAQFETDKRSVYKHPLFPLLALLFERCELATQSSDPTQSSDAFNMDIQAFVQHQERDRKPFLANEPEVDGLMIKAIQVLRIHLLELEKVQELCKDFCNRYITCLKGKMQSENLLRSDYPTHQGQLIGGGGGLGGGFESNNNNSMLTRDESGGSESNSPVPNTVPSTPNSILTPYQPQQQCPEPTSYTQQQQYTHLQQQQFNNTTSTSSNDSNNHLQLPSSVVHGSTPLSQIGLQSSNLLLTSDNDNSIHSNPMTPHTPGQDDLLLDDDDDCMDDCSSSNDFTGAGAGHMMIGGGLGQSGGGSRRSHKTKRGVLPKQATSVMRSWLFQHLVHPYPTEDEKRGIAAQTNLTLLQVNNWFINARRRILQPMLDASSVTAPNNTSTTNPSPASMTSNLPPITSTYPHPAHHEHTDLDVRRRKKRKRNRKHQRFWTTDTFNNATATRNNDSSDDDADDDRTTAGGDDNGGGGDSYNSSEEDMDDDDDDDERGGSQLVIDATVAPSSPGDVPVNGHHLMSSRTRTPTK